MISRDEYVQKLKSEIDYWNAEAARWEAGAQERQGSWQDEARRQLEHFRQRSEEAMTQLRRVQNASGDAWSEMMRGADAAFSNMQEAFDRARKSFQPPPK
jgi:hypothetical protein